MLCAFAISLGLRPNRPSPSPRPSRRLSLSLGRTAAAGPKGEQRSTSCPRLAGSRNRTTVKTEDYKYAPRHAKSKAASDSHLRLSGKKKRADHLKNASATLDFHPRVLYCASACTGEPNQTSDRRRHTTLVARASSSFCKTRETIG